MFWLRKMFLGGVPKSAHKYWDHHDCHDDPEKLANFSKLTQWMASTIPPDRVIHYKEASFHSYKSKDDIWSRQICRWRDDVHKLLQKSLDEVMELRKDWNLDGCGVGECLRLRDMP